MLIKEYRIPMPMSVEEYRIAQLYMIQVSVIQLHCQTAHIVFLFFFTWTCQWYSLHQTLLQPGNSYYNRH